MNFFGDFDDLFNALNGNNNNAANNNNEMRNNDPRMQMGEALVMVVKTAEAYLTNTEQT